jgi:hypothetical protein
LSSIRSLSEQDVQEIRAVLDQVARRQDETPERDVDVLREPGTVRTAIKSVPTRPHIANFRQVLEVLATLYQIKSARDASVEEFVDDVCDAMESLDSDLRLPHAERADFAGKLLTLLNADLFALVTKALDLATEDERTFCHARILTDLRPVFGANIEDGPAAMIIMHTMKLAYHEQGKDKHSEFYVSLDAKDLETLRKLIDRAEAKARALNSSVKSVRLFGMFGE